MCGILGIASTVPVVPDLYNGLLMLQHRGQDAAGMVTYDQHFHIKKENGLVSEVFNPSDANVLKGNIGIGHVRYRTAGSLDPSAAQPFLVKYPTGICLIHNGNLTNTSELREKVTKKYHRYLNSDSDSELIVNVFANELIGIKSNVPTSEELFKATAKTMPQIQGAYAIIMLIAGAGILAFRDPYGIRPLIYGSKKVGTKTEYMVASESVALEALGFKVIADVQPGEAIFIDLKNKFHKFQCLKPQAKKPCIFEFVYLARPDSMIDDISVYRTRLRMGEKLAKKVTALNLQIDAVIPVPETARPSAMALAAKLNLPYREGLIKNRYIGRTFIMPGQAKRNKSIKQKLSAIQLEFKGKNVLLVDDSIVRGNTSKQIIQLCREAGAKKVYLASAAPPIINPDVYGVDIPTRKELIAHGRSIDQIKKIIGADALVYQDIQDLIASASEGSSLTNEFSTGCFDFGYATPEVTEKLLKEVEKAYQFRETEEDGLAPSTFA